MYILLEILVALMVVAFLLVFLADSKKIKSKNLKHNLMIGAVIMVALVAFLLFVLFLAGSIMSDQAYEKRQKEQEQAQQQSVSQ